MAQIEDGTGSGAKASVDASNRLLTKAIENCDCKDNSINKAQSYEFATGAFIAPTTTAEHAILYVKNTSSTKRLHIHVIRTCGSVVQQWILYKNDTGGTIISDANAGVEVNHNFSSSNVAEADVWAASAAGKTRSGGSWMSQHINDVGHSNVDYEGALILSQNDSLTLTVQNVASATTLSCARIHAYYEDK
jgi:hypothetical protein